MSSDLPITDFDCQPSLGTPSQIYADPIFAPEGATTNVYGL